MPLERKDLVGAPEMRPDSILSKEAVYNILPHRWPFMFLGGVAELVPGVQAKGWLVDLAHPDINWREGHFPQRPLVPGVIVQEALAQLGALTVLSLPQYKGMIAKLTGVDNLKVRSEMIPGEEVRLEVEGMKFRRMMGNIHGTGSVRALNGTGRLTLGAKLAFVIVNQ